MQRLTRLALVALGAGVAGWALENAFAAPPPRYSALAPGLPFLPVYAAGGIAVALLAPRLRSVHPVGRALVYAGVLTGLEAVAGVTERTILGHRSWDYEGSPVDLPHAAAWGVLGLGAEAVLRRGSAPAPRPALSRLASLGGPAPRGAP